MDLKKSDVEELTGLMEMAHGSLWFLSSMMKKENWSRTLLEVYQETLGKVSTMTGTPADAFNAANCLVLGYIAFVIPKEALQKSFEKQSDINSRLSFANFDLYDGGRGRWAEDSTVTLARMRWHMRTSC